MGKKKKSTSLPKAKKRRLTSKDGVSFVINEAKVKAIKKMTLKGKALGNYFDNIIIPNLELSKKRRPDKKLKHFTRVKYKIGRQVGYFSTRAVRINTKKGMKKYAARFKASFIESMKEYLKRKGKGQFSIIEVSYESTFGVKGKQMRKPKKGKSTGASSTTKTNRSKRKTK